MFRSNKLLRDIIPICPSSLAEQTWVRLNVVDLSFLARATSQTCAVVPSGLPVPLEAQESLCRMRRLTDLYRDDRLCIPHIIERAPLPEGDPMDFPVDALGIACWPWRQLLWDCGWDAIVTWAPQRSGRAILIGAWPGPEARAGVMSA